MTFNQFVEEIIFQFVNMNVRNNSLLFSKFLFIVDQYEYASFDNVTQRRFVRIFINLTMKKLVKFRKFFDVSFSL